MAGEKKIVYADANASSPIKPIILKEIENHLKISYGNPSNLHALGQLSKKILEDSRKIIAGSLSISKPKDIIFTSGGTESNVLGVLGFAKALKPKIRQVLVSEIEHSSILGLKDHICQEGLKFELIRVTKDGLVDMNDLKEKLSKEPSLVSIMFANNETGVIQPIKELDELIHAGGHFFHCDAVQAFGKVKMELDHSNIDCLSVSGHKIGALKGIGALYVRDGFDIKPIFGDGSHERSWRSGTENLTGVWSLGLACDDFNDYSDLEKAKNNFDVELKKEFGVIIAGENSKRLGNTSCVIFPGSNQDLLLAGLDLHGISASAGSACKANASMPSHVLKAMGIEKELLKSVIRFSFTSDVLPADFDHILSTLAKLIKK